MHWAFQNMFYSCLNLTKYVGGKSVSLNLKPFFQTYLKEILKEIGTYNNKGPHKSTWEVKPEYRHYQPAEDA